jgi:hypothetical protein
VLDAQLSQENPASIERILPVEAMAAARYAEAEMTYINK